MLHDVTVKGDSVKRTMIFYDIRCFYGVSFMTEGGGTDNRQYILCEFVTHSYIGIYFSPD
jgi:hypothetical protein